MPSCDACRPLIPDHLYGLLDAPEEAAVAAHLAGCPACAAARDEAARVQGLIAAAARGTFPAVRFEAPAARPKTAPAPAAPARRAAVVPFPAPGDRAAEPARRPAPGGRSAAVARWLPWAVAAAVLVAVPGTVLPVRDLLSRAEAARAAAADTAARSDQARLALDSATAEAGRPLADAQFKLLAAQQQHDGVLARWVDEEKAALQALEARRVTWEVRKPAAVQPGAPNEFLLVVRDPGAAPPGRLLAEVRDQTDAVVHSQPIDPGRAREHTVRLPAAAWGKLTPESELYLVVTREDRVTGEKFDLPDRVRLLGPVYATALTTDKAAYRPGETVYFRSLTLDRVTLTPPAREQVLQFELRGPGGHPVRAVPAVAGSTDLVRVGGGGVEPVPGPGGGPVRGVGCGAFALPPDAPDGDYTLVLREQPRPGAQPAVPVPVTRTVKVRSGAAEAFRKELVYGAASYAPGDTVEARARLRLGDDPVAGAEVAAVAVADGRVLAVSPVGDPVTGADGKAVFRFTLPADLDKADVRVMATFRAASGKRVVEEAVAAPVPVVGRSVVVEFFPEGGDLVAGVPCRVYVRATTPAGHPVDVRGVVTDGRRELARVESPTDPAAPGANRGIAAFTFTPELGAPAWLKLASADGRFPSAPAAAAGAAAAAVRTGYPLPEVKIDGVVITVPDPVTAPGQPVRVHLRSVGQDRNLVVGAYTRGRLSDTRRVAAAAGQLTEVRLMAGTDPRGGVVRVTVFEEPEEGAGKPAADLKPVAERLVFRKPGETLNLSYTATGAKSGAGFAPGAAVELGIAAADEKGSPTPAVVYAGVVNTADAPGGTDRLPTTHFLLAGEVSTPDALEHADFLLTDHPKAAEALDLVLATQGWRRFAEQTPEGFARNPVVATPERANLALENGQRLAWAEPGWAREQERLRGEHLPKYLAAAAAYQAAKAEADLAKAAGPGDVSAPRAAADRAAAAAAAAAVEAAAAAEPVARFRASGWYAVGGLAGLAGLLAGLAVARPVARFPLGAGTVGAAGLAAFLVAALGTADRLQAARPDGDTARVAAPEAAPAAGAAVAPEPRIGRAAPVVPPPAGAVEMALATGKGRDNNFGGPPDIVPGRGEKKEVRPPPWPPGAPGLGKKGGDAGFGGKFPGGYGWEPHRRSEIPTDLLARPETDRAAGDRKGPEALLARGDARAESKAVELLRAMDQAKSYAADKANVVRSQMATALARGGVAAAAPPPAPFDRPSPEAAAFFRVQNAVPEVPPLVVREYAAPRPGADGRAADPGDTVLWQPVVVLPADGKATLRFHLGNAPGGYQVIVAGHTLDGRVGAVRGVIPVVSPAP
ncbi:MAG: hypothetical protein C0501_03215 [Isosphaera sp.]|nr:hypothetical protein [Isosphaera sp.]